MGGIPIGIEALVGGIQIVMGQCVLMGGRGSLWVRWLWLVLARHGQSWLVVSWIRSVGFYGG